MACSLCDRPARVPRGPGRVFVSAPVAEVLLKIVERVRGWPEVLKPHDGALEGQSEDFPAFLDRLLAEPWSVLEKSSVTVLFLPPGKVLTFAASQQTRTLGEWEGLREGRFLANLLDSQTLVSHFQRITDLRDDSVYGWECLLRGVGTDGELISPGRLFSAAQESGMLFPLDRQARLTALRCAHEAQLPGRLFINFLPTAIYDPVFCLRTTVELVATLGLDPRRIVFEVVESEHIADEAHLKDIVDYYRAQGFQVALDDVGSGYASLNLLIALHPDVLKVDQKIIRGIDHQPANQAVFRALAGIARDTGALLLAEGVETAAELEWARHHGATLAQGFLWGRPEARPDTGTGGRLG